MKVNGVWAIKSSNDYLKSLHEPPTQSQRHVRNNDFDKIFKEACRNVNKDKGTNLTPVPPIENDLGG